MGRDNMDVNIMLGILFLCLYFGISMIFMGIYIEIRTSSNLLFDVIGFGLPSVIFLSSIAAFFLADDLFFADEQKIVAGFFLFMGVISILSGVFNYYVAKKGDEDYIS